GAVRAPPLEELDQLEPQELVALPRLLRVRPQRIEQPAEGARGQVPLLLQDHRHATWRWFEATPEPSGRSNTGRPAHTPRWMSGQSCLWSWICRRAGTPSARIQDASSAGWSAPWTGEKSTGSLSKRPRSRARSRDHS